VGAVRIHGELPERLHAYATPAAGPLSFDVRLLDDTGAVVASIDGFTLRAVPAGDVVEAFEPVRVPAPAVRAPLTGGVLVLGDGGAEVRDALTAAGVTAWHGEPGGVVSHVVHLAGPHPGDLHQALAFLQAWQRRSALAS